MIHVKSRQSPISDGRGAAAGSTTPRQHRFNQTLLPSSKGNTVSGVRIENCKIQKQQKTLIAYRYLFEIRCPEMLIFFSRVNTLFLAEIIQTLMPLSPAMLTQLVLKKNSKIINICP